MLNQSISFKITVFVGVMWAILLAPLSAFADGGAKVSLREVEATEGQMTVEVVAEDVVDLYGMEFQISYDPSVLSVQDAVADQDGVQIAMGDFLPAEKGFVVANQANISEQTITLAATLLNPAPAVSGEGVLASITFDVLNNNSTSLELNHLNLVSAKMEPIPTQMSGLSIGREVATIVESNDGENTLVWALVGGAIIITLLTIGGAAFFMVSQSKSAPQPQQTQPQTAS